jgi:hypothetical protein
MRKVYYPGLIILLLTLLLLFSAFSPTRLYASSRQAHTNGHASSAWTAATTAWANVRTGPGTNYDIVNTYAPGTSVTVYATVSGEIVWDGISNWYRISSLASNPLYIYSGLVAANSSSNNNSPPPSTQGKVIVVSIAKQWMYVYQDGNQVYDSPVTTGQPALPTPPGTYSVIEKLHPTTFYSPWPQGSPYWYPPSHIEYALEWDAQGYFLHDSWWRTVYGPGTEVWHYDPVYGQETGTHGCVTMPLDAATWLYNWAPIGTTVKVE